MLRKSIQKYGTVKLTLLITLLSILLSLVITILVNYLFNNEFVGFMGVFVAILVPALLAPTFSSIQFALMSQLYDAEEQLHQLAITDELTQTYNRRHFIELAGQVMEQSKNNGGTFTIVILDMDNFKEINDTYGHLAGDQILRHFGEICRKALPESVLLARYGGDEFVFLLCDAGAEQVAQSIKALRNAVAQTHLQLGEKLLTIQASLGSATYHPTIVDLDTLLAQADQEMYLEKRAKRKTFDA